MAHTFIPIREHPRQPDDLDAKRIELVRGRWSAQDAAMVTRARQIEENVRMIAGRQWDVYSEVLGRFVDVTRYMTDDERRWRQRPVINYLQYWFMLTHARLTENPPIVTFQPSSADRIDAMLAEVMDTIYKTLWNSCGMLEVDDLVTRWIVAAGYGFVKSAVDYKRGPERELIGDAVLSLDSPDGSIERYIEHAPYDAQGNPLVTLTEDGEGYDILGEPAKEREGEICVNVLNPLECRGEWGNSIPWHKKRWHIHRSYLPPEVVYERWGVECEPDTYLDGGEDGGFLERLLASAGYYGAVTHAPGSELGGSGMQSNNEGYVCVDEMWEAPSGNSPETDESPGGRLLIVTPSQVLHDSVRPFRCKYTSPIRYFEFVGIPGRPAGSSPVEMMIPIQKAINRGAAQILEHRNLMTNPKVLIDPASGLDEGDFSNAPGEGVIGGMREGQRMVDYLSPPPLSGDVWRTQKMLEEVLLTLGNIHGAEGTPPTPDASGELVKELRFNSDRFIAATARNKVVEYARLIEDWMAILPTIWTEEKIIAYAGDDSVVRTVTVLPEMWDGKVNVIPDIESMLPEGRGERQQRALVLYERGLFGDPNSPEAKKVFLEIGRFPHLGRVYRPGGVNRITAEQNLGELVRGATWEDIPIYEWYDLNVHLAVTEEFMCTPEFKKLAPEIQTNLGTYREALRGAIVAKELNQQRIAGQLQLAAGAQQAMVATQAATMLPAPSPSTPPMPPDGGPVPDDLSAMADRAA